MCRLRLIRNTENAISIKRDLTTLALDLGSPYEAASKTRLSYLPDEVRVLHVLDHSLPIHSGYSFRTVSLIREQRHRGWNTIQLTTPKHTDPGPLTEEIDGLIFHRTPPASFANKPVLGEISLIRAVAQRIEEIATVEGPNILHAHSPVLNALACLRAGRRLGLPVIYEVRGFWEDAAVSHGTAIEDGLRYRLTRSIEGYALKHADAVIAICDGLRRDMVARGIPAERVTVIPNGVDTAEFSFGSEPDRPLKAQLQLDGCLVLGFMGSFYAYEGLDLLLDALPLIRRENRNVAVLLVGGGPAEDELKEQARRLGIEKSVRFVGRVQHDDIQRYYSIVDIFVYPRHAMRLTEKVTPLKPLEAMALGGIVLGSDVGGHRELIRDGENGFLFKADDIEDLTRSIAHLVRRRESWRDIAQTARRFVERERSWPVTTAHHPEAYACAFESARRNGRRQTRL